MQIVSVGARIIDHYLFQFYAGNNQQATTSNPSSPEQIISDLHLIILSEILHEYGVKSVIKII